MTLGHITLRLATLGVGALLAACDREVSHETKVKVTDDEVNTEETTVSETPQGNIKVAQKTTQTVDGKTRMRHPCAQSVSLASRFGVKRR